MNKQQLEDMIDYVMADEIDNKPDKKHFFGLIDVDFSPKPHEGLILNEKLGSATHSFIVKIIRKLKMRGLFLGMDENELADYSSSCFAIYSDKLWTAVERELEDEPFYQEELPLVIAGATGEEFITGIYRIGDLSQWYMVMANWTENDETVIDVKVVSLPNLCTYLMQH